ncbi:hypothetical protein OG478_52845 (plasmid) [Streptomyces phaeochromogenes]|uniref:hypothetical protein n=1 Tax=Streptomyces phaeochromogenes TaxID=1923 RepID=UPI002F9128D7|nr:hypothetical protein OG478_52845 [Streptomyces phaeochromogenes]
MNVLPRIHAVAESLGVPPWTVALGGVLACVAALALLILVVRLAGRAATRAVEKARRDDDSEARARVMAMIDDRWRTIVGICGMSVSMYGLYGFAEDTAGLPLLLRIFFIAIFDGAEIGLMLGLARSLAAQDVPRWTEGMIRSRRMAWGLVALSAAANWVHAPEGGGLWAKVALAGVPVVSVKLLEHGLDLRIAELAKAEEEDGVRPGPLRLFVLLWRRIWIAAFAWLGLDTTSTTSETSRRLLAQRAARAVIVLARAQKRADRTFRFGWRKSLADRAVDRRTEDAAVALDRADAPVNVDQALAVVRRTMGHMQAGRLGRLDYADVDAVVNTVVSLPALQQKVTQKLEEQKAEVQDELRAAERAAKAERDEAVAALEAEREERTRLQAEQQQERERFEELAEQLREQAEQLRTEAEQARREAAEQVQLVRDAVEQSATREAEDRRAERETTEQRAEREAKRWHEQTEQLRDEAKRQLQEQAERFEQQSAEQVRAERDRWSRELEQLRTEAERQLREQAEQLRTEAEQAKREATERVEREAAERLAAERAEAERKIEAERAEAERKVEAERAEAEHKITVAQEQAEQLQAQLDAKQAEPEQTAPAGTAEQPRTPKPREASKSMPTLAKGSLKQRFIQRVHELCEQGESRLLGPAVTPRTRTDVAYQVQAELGLTSQGTARTYMQEAMERWEAAQQAAAEKKAPAKTAEAKDKGKGKLLDTFGRPIADLDALESKGALARI